MTSPLILFDPFLTDLVAAGRFRAATDVSETVSRWRNPPGRSYAPGTKL